MFLATKYTLKPTLKANFKGIIWKVETDPTGHIVVVETRNPEDRTTYFSAFDFNRGKTLFFEISVSDGWNWGLDFVCHGYVYLHSYINDKTPEHKGIIALDRTGKIAWQVFNKALESVVDEGLIAYNPSIQQKQFELLDPATGQVTKQNIKQFKSFGRVAYFPEPTSSQERMKDLEDYKSIVGPIFHLAHKDKDVYSFHVANGPSFSLYLVIKHMGNHVHEEILERDIQKLNPEPFYIEHSHLFCIRNNKSEIVAYLV